MIKVVIIEDEELDRTMLLDSLAKHCPDVEVLAACDNAKEGKAAIQKYHPDLVFTDVELDRKKVFDMLKELGDVDFEVIFVTSHRKYAIQAIKLSALDYLKKPFTVAELTTALNTYRQKRKNKQSPKPQLDALAHNLSNGSPDSKKIVLPTSNGRTVVFVKDIIRCQSDANYTTFFLTNKNKMVVARTLGDFEELLNDYGFSRVHASHLINLHHVKNYIRGEGGSVMMDDGSEVKVSRRKKDEFLSRLGKL